MQARQLTIYGAGLATLLFAVGALATPPPEHRDPAPSPAAEPEEQRHAPDDDAEPDARARLHPGGPPTGQEFPALAELSCPGTRKERFSELEAMDADALLEETRRVLAAAAAEPSKLALVVDASSVLMTRWKKLPGPEREAVLTVESCEDESTLLPIALRDGESKRLLESNYDLFVDFVTRNHGKEEVSSNDLLCATITPLFNALRVQDYEALPVLTRRLSEQLPAPWLRETIEELGGHIVRDVGWTALLQSTLEVAREAGIDSVPVRNLQFVVFVCQRRLDEARALLIETSELAPDDDIIRDNLKWIEEEIEAR